MATFRPFNAGFNKSSDADAGLFQYRRSSVDTEKINCWSQRSPKIGLRSVQLSPRRETFTLKWLLSGSMLLCMIAWLWPPLFECNAMASTNKLARSLIAFLIRPDAFNMVEWFACPTLGDGKQEPPPSFFLLLSYTFWDVVSRPYFLSPPFCRHGIFEHCLGSIPPWCEKSGGNTVVHEKT